MMKLPSLNALRVFEAAARYQSLVKAADELCVTQSAVSRQLTQLEGTLGLQLFERRNRGIFLTPQGEQLQAGCQEMFDILKQTLKAMQAPENQPPLVVSCEPTIMMKWLIPRLAEFQSLHPEIEVHLSASGGPIDWRHSQADIAIRRDDFSRSPNDHAAIIGPELTGPVVLTESWEQRASDTEPVTRLHTQTRPSAWQVWQQNARQAVPVRDEVWFEHFYIMLEAVYAGTGWGLGSIYMVDSDIRNRQLTAPFGFTPDGSSYCLLSPNAIEADKRVVALLDWLRQAFQETTERVMAALPARP
ncbi:LysR family transcriptional regulator [Photobacterium sp. GJ3]|uniref:LysR family transcriptional regulator n=1 Tax=Photobacterium sp. GJ3 TaxID=2829502 RepID=UPI001B8CCD51|nr:LysR family transcriptional regulator [Photobacterium sp. GJ3]QUJ67792.1 LysR family transcriptional regulator [Photobacterium sp. GJ3]